MDCVKIGNLIAKLRKEKNLPREILQMHWVFKIKLFQNGNVEFPKVKDTTPDITIPRLYMKPKSIIYTKKAGSSDSIASGFYICVTNGS